MSKIKFRLEVWDKTVVFQILDMDERFRRLDGEWNKEFVSENWLNVMSEGSPMLTNNVLFLRGVRDNNDCNAVSKSFLTREEANEYCQKVINSLLDWAENWEGWGNEEAETDDDIPNVYEF